MYCLARRALSLEFKKLKLSRSVEGNRFKELPLKSNLYGLELL